MIIPIEFDIHNQSLHIGETAFPFVPADSLHPGAVRVGHEKDSAVLRPLTFGERYEISMRAAMTGDPVEALCQWVLKASTLERDGTPDQHVLETMALIVSGGNEETPPYTESLRMLSAQAGWSVDHIEKASSTFVDRILIDLTSKQDDGWTRVLFGNDAKNNAVSILEARKKLAENLLRRLDPGFVTETENHSKEGLLASLPGTSSSSSSSTDPVAHTPAYDNKTATTDSLAGKQSESKKDNALSNTARNVLSSESPNEQPVHHPGPIIRHRNHLPVTSSDSVPPMATKPAFPGTETPSSTSHSPQLNHVDSGILSNQVFPGKTAIPHSNTQNVVPGRHKTQRHTKVQDLQRKEGLLFPVNDSHSRPAPAPSLETVFQSTFFHNSTDFPQPATVNRPYAPESTMHNRLDEDPFHIAQQLALLLDQEADLRGIDR